MRNARRRLVLCGHAPALAARKKAARLGCNPRPCGTQEGGLSRAATHPPLRQARGRLVLCGHAPALAAGKRAACPVRPRTRPCRRQGGGSPGVQPPRPPGRLNGRRRRSWRGRGRWDRLRCSPPIPCWASRNPSPWGPGRGNIFQRSPGTAGIPW